MMHRAYPSKLKSTCCMSALLACVIAAGAMGLPPSGLAISPARAQAADAPMPAEAEREALRSSACDHNSLSQSDRLDCAKQWDSASDDTTRAEVARRYEALAESNRIAPDTPATAADALDPEARDAAVPGLDPTAPVQPDSLVERSDSAWLLTVGGGATLLGLAIAYGVVRTRRKKSGSAQAAQDRGTRAAYEDRP